MSEFDYLRDPEAIYRASFAAIDQAADWTGVAAAMVPVYRRLVHAFTHHRDSLSRPINLFPSA